MWIKLSNDYLNMDQAFRVRITRGFRNGEEECVAEVETIDPRGQVSAITRFRGADAQMLQTVLADRCRTDSEAAAGDTALSHPQTGTVADLKLP
jgi:hypothetical protein